DPLLESGDALLEHRGGGVAGAGVGEAVRAPLEQCLERGMGGLRVRAGRVDRRGERPVAVRGGVPSCVDPCRAHRCSSPFVMLTGPFSGAAPGAGDLYDGVWRAGRGSVAGVSSRGVPSAVQRPEVPRRCEPSRWVSTTPRASMRANIVVGPTNRKPRRLSSRARATDSELVVG